MSLRSTVLAAALFGCLGPAAAVPGNAGKADVVGAEVTPEAGGTHRVSVTVRHADEGWEHYADRWQVVAPDGTVLGTRTLYHPHVEEQPFTRALGGVAIPAGIKEVTIRARDSKHGEGGAEVRVPVPGR